VHEMDADYIRAAASYLGTMLSAVLAWIAKSLHDRVNALESSRATHDQVAELRSEIRALGDKIDASNVRAEERNERMLTMVLSALKTNIG
jgi:flagellar motility protein MotE (MotC chaperone)